MTGLDVTSAQQSILDYAAAEMPAWTITEGEWSDGATVPMQNGVMQGYVIVRFSDGLLPTTSDTNFGGPKFDGYYTLVQFQSVATSAVNARTIMNKVNQAFIGFKPDDSSGPMTKSYGGGAFTIPGTNSSPQYFVAICSFRFQTNMQVS